VTAASKRQIKTLAYLTDAVVIDPDNEANIEALKKTLETAGLIRKDAVEQYESHLLTHGKRALRAGAESL
jgi:hypothetical protein